MARHNAKQHPVSILDYVWQPSIVLAPSGKPLVYKPGAFTTSADKRRWDDSSRKPPNKAADIMAVFEILQPHQGKHK
jgi:hypothetical protein